MGGWGVAVDGSASVPRCSVRPPSLSPSASPLGYLLDGAERRRLGGRVQGRGGSTGESRAGQGRAGQLCPRPRYSTARCVRAAAQRGGEAVWLWTSAGVRPGGERTREGGREPARVSVARSCCSSQAPARLQPARPRAPRLPLRGALECRGAAGPSAGQVSMSERFSTHL